MSSAPRHARSFRATALAGIAYQGVVVLYQLLIPAVLSRRFDAEVLGLWLTVYSLLGVAQVATLGVPGALLTHLDGSERADRDANAVYVRGGLLLTLACSAVPLVLALLTPFLPWESWLAIPAAAGSPPAFFATCLVVTGLTLLAALGQTLHIATHRAHRAYVLTTLVYLAWIPCVLFGARLGDGLWFLAGLFLMPPLLSGFLLWAAGLREGYVSVAGPVPSGTLRKLLETGAPFLALDLVVSLIVRTPEAFVSGSHGLAEAGRFSVVQRFPFLLSAVQAVVLQPLWPSLAAATRASNRAAAAALVRRGLLATLWLGAAFALAVALFGEFLLEAWLGTDLGRSPRGLMLSIAYGLALSLYAWTSLCMLGMSARRANLRVGLWMLAAYVPLAFLLTRSLAADGAFLALILVFGLVGAPLGWREVRRRLALLAAPDPAQTSPAKP